MKKKKKKKKKNDETCVSRKVSVECSTAESSFAGEGADVKLGKLILTLTAVSARGEPVPKLRRLSGAGRKFERIYAPLFHICAAHFRGPVVVSSLFDVPRGSDDFPFSNLPDFFPNFTADFRLAWRKRNDRSWLARKRIEEAHLFLTREFWTVRGNMVLVTRFIIEIWISNATMRWRDWSQNTTRYYLFRCNATIRPYVLRVKIRKECVHHLLLWTCLNVIYIALDR